MTDEEFFRRATRLIKRGPSSVKAQEGSIIIEDSGSSAESIGGRTDPDKKGSVGGSTKGAPRSSRDEALARRGSEVASQSVDALIDEIEMSEAWLMDSGTSRHMTSTDSAQGHPLAKASLVRLYTANGIIETRHVLMLRLTMMGDIPA